MAALGMMVTTFALESEDLGVESHIMRDWNKAKSKLVIIAVTTILAYFLKANKQFALFHSNNDNDQWSFL